MRRLLFRSFNIFIVTLVFCFSCSEKKSNESKQNFPSSSSQGSPMDDVGSESENYSEEDPAFPEDGKYISEFIPKTYSLLVKDSGDLNNDHLNDFVFVIEPKNSADATVPRTLLICFGEKDGALKLTVVSKKAYASKFDTLGQEISKFDILDVDSGKIMISQFKVGIAWNSCFTYKWFDGAFYLTDYSSYAAGAGGSTTIEYDFVTKKMRITDYNGFTDSETSRDTVYHLNVKPKIDDIDEEKDLEFAID